MPYLLALLALFIITPAAHAEEVPQTPLEHELYSMQEGDVALGDADAPITIIEYSSLSCPHCAAFHNKVLPALKAAYIDTGKVKLIARPFPLNGPALAGSKIIECVDGERHHKFVEVLFKLQEKWAFASDFNDRLKQIAQVGGMDEAEADACLNNQETEKAILESRQRAGEELIVQSTPTFFINGEKLVGAGTIEIFSEVIDRKLEAKADE